MLQVKSLPEFHELRERFLRELLYNKDDSGTTAAEAKKMRHFPSGTHNFIPKVGQFFPIFPTPTSFAF